MSSHVEAKFHHEEERLIINYEEELSHEDHEPPPAPPPPSNYGKSYEDSSSVKTSYDDSYRKSVPYVEEKRGSRGDYGIGDIARRNRCQKRGPIITRLRCFSFFGFFSALIREIIPSYLASLPIPDSLCGWLKLGIKDILRLIPFTAFCGGVGYTIYSAYIRYTIRYEKGVVNFQILKRYCKVVHVINVDDAMVEKAVPYCRCWKSGIFPYCDGSHRKHNDDTGDNVGPLIIKPRDDPTLINKVKAWLGLGMVLG